MRIFTKMATYRSLTHYATTPLAFICNARYIKLKTSRDYTAFK